MAELHTDTIDAISTHIICKARAYLQDTNTAKPARVIVQERRRKALADVINKSLDSFVLSDPAIAAASRHLVQGLAYPESDKDVEAFVRVLTNLSYMLEDANYQITGGRKTFEYAIDGMLLRAAIDMTVRDMTSGYVYPALVDFSHTRYEPYYNPVVYHAQAIVDYLELTGTNSQVLIFTAAEGKVWKYDHRKYGAMVHASLAEAMHERTQSFNGARFGWWCSGCPYRGICHSLLKETI